jgi:hypothetical protein
MCVREKYNERVRYNIALLKNGRRILLTSGAGFIGSHVLDVALNEGHRWNGKSAGN